MNLIKNIVLFITILFSSCILFKPYSNPENKLLITEDGSYLSSDTANDITPFMYKSPSETNYLLFASDRDGNYDIFYAIKVNDTVFKSPVKLSNVNTSVNEYSPVMFNDNTNVYISFIRDSGTNKRLETRRFRKELEVDTTFSNYLVLPTNINHISVIQGSDNILLLASGGNKEIRVYSFIAGEREWHYQFTLTNLENIYSACGVSESGINYFIYEVVKSGNRSFIGGGSVFNIVQNNVNIDSYLSIKTGVNDSYPFIEKETGTLYFSSTRYGKGKYDLYRYNNRNFSSILKEKVTLTGISRPTKNELIGEWFLYCQMNYYETNYYTNNVSYSYYIIKMIETNNILYFIKYNACGSSVVSVETNIAEYSNGVIRVSNTTYNMVYLYDVRYITGNNRILFYNYRYIYDGNTNWMYQEEYYVKGDYSSITSYVPPLIYYVDLEGSDNNSGTNQNRPFKSINRALEVAMGSDRNVVILVRPYMASPYSVSNNGLKTNEPNGTLFVITNKSNIKIIGSFDPNMYNPYEKAILGINSNVSRLFLISNSSFIEFINFKIEDIHNISEKNSTIADIKNSSNIRFSELYINENVTHNTNSGYYISIDNSINVEIISNNISGNNSNTLCIGLINVNHSTNISINRNLISFNKLNGDNISNSYISIGTNCVNISIMSNFIHNNYSAVNILAFRHYVVNPNAIIIRDNVFDIEGLPNNILFTNYMGETIKVYELYKFNKYTNNAGLLGYANNCDNNILIPISYNTRVYFPFNYDLRNSSFDINGAINASQYAYLSGGGSTTPFGDNRYGLPTMALNFNGNNCITNLNIFIDTNRFTNTIMFWVYVNDFNNDQCLLDLYWTNNTGAVNVERKQLSLYIEKTTGELYLTNKYDNNSYRSGIRLEDHKSYLIAYTSKNIYDGSYKSVINIYVNGAVSNRNSTNNINLSFIYNNPSFKLASAFIGGSTNASSGSIEHYLNGYISMFRVICDEYTEAMIRNHYYGEKSRAFTKIPFSED